MSEKNTADQKIGVPLGIYKDRYKASDKDDITRRTGVVFDDKLNAFSLFVLGFELSAAWPEFSLKPKDPACPSILYGGEAQILLMRYLIEGRRADATGNWLSYRELPWGDVYDKNFQGRCRMRLAFGFGSRLDAFAKACTALGGVPYTKGDVSFDLAFLPGIIVRLELWAGDDEFPPQSQWLFSDNTPLAFSAEDVAVVGDVIIGALKDMASRP